MNIKNYLQQSCECHVSDAYENLSEAYEVTLNGEKLTVYDCLVSAYPINQVWPGYQRPVVQAEKSSYVMLFSVTAESSMWSSDKRLGQINEVTFSNIRVWSEEGAKPTARIYTSDKSVIIDNVNVSEIFLNDKPYEPEIYRE